MADSFDICAIKYNLFVFTFLLHKKLPIKVISPVSPSVCTHETA
jgi:hypothetical protein